MGKVRPIFLILVIAGALLQANAHAEDGAIGDDYEVLKKKLKSLSSSPGNSTVGISVVELKSGAPIFQKNADELKNPASNAKIITAACALKTLGPQDLGRGPLFSLYQTGKTLPSPGMALPDRPGHRHDQAR